jgi:putative drug exporter of the RND superfamily
MRRRSTARALSASLARVRFSPQSLARASSLHPWRTLAAWLALVVVSFFLVATLLDGVLTSEAEITRETESDRAEELLAEAFPPVAEDLDRSVTEVVVLRASSGTVEPERVEALAEDIRAAGATFVQTPAQGEGLLSEDGDAAAVLVGLGRDEEEKVDGLVAAVERLDAEPGYEAAVTGEWTADADFGQLSQDDLREGELFFGAPAALVILLLVFGTVVAGLLPLVLAIVSIVVALALTALLGQAFELSLFVVNMLTGMGLALGIDYTLFILSRYREERAQRREKLDAIAVAGATASRAVLFSGMAFVLAMFGLVLVPSSIFRSLAAGAILVAIVSVIAALTLLPAVLSLVGDRVNALRLPFFGRVAERSGSEGRFWGAIARAVMGRPVVSLVCAAALLVAAAVPVLSLETGSSGIATLPDRFESKQGFLLLNEEFPGQTTDPVEVAVSGDLSAPETQAGLRQFTTAVGRHPLFGQPTVEESESGRVARVTFPVAGDAIGEEAIGAVRELRGEIVPQAFSGVEANALVGGDTAVELEYHDTVDAWLPWVFLFVLGLSFVLLTVAFRSIVVSAKAIVLNLLSVGAAYGLLVLVFQKGIGNELFGFEQADSVEAWVPLFLFSVLFGLSMDYQVFLLSRIRETYVLTGDNLRAVQFGIVSTGRLITGAALIIIAVFWGFAMGDLIMFQQMGFGVAVALLIDATIVRSVLVPATMTLLGRWNWYLPSWLTWLPDAHVEGHEERRRPAPATGS